MFNEKVKKDGGYSVLWGCSVAKELLQETAVVEDMKRYDWITARESITFEALKKAGVKNVILCADPAFALPYIETDFSRNLSNNIIGINFSPYALGNDRIGFQNYMELVDWILGNTDLDILLIPHVFKSHSNDVTSLRMLFQEINNKERVTLISNEYNCCELKGIIRRCLFFVGARTHSTIAAYSSCVPTLVLGYSVKAKGIAKDLFGSYENYVVPVQELTDTLELTHKFQWLYEHEDEIRHHLNEIMPAYIQSAYKGAEVLKQFVKKTN